jgi:hypothetical protein
VRVASATEEVMRRKKNVKTQMPKSHLRIPVRCSVKVCEELTCHIVGLLKNLFHQRSTGHPHPSGLLTNLVYAGIGVVLQWCSWILMGV